jgi:hypothetical protein
MASTLQYQRPKSSHGQFSIRGLLEWTTISAIIFAFSQDIGILAAIALTLMAGFMMVRSGILVLTCFCLGMLTIHDQADILKSGPLYLILATLVALWPMAVQLRIKLPVKKRSWSGSTPIDDRGTLIHTDRH